MYFIRGIIRKTKGVTLIEVITTISMFSIIISLIITTYGVWMKNYKDDIEYSKGVIEINEALMYIDYHINYNGKGYVKSGDKIIIPSNDGVSEDYIRLSGNELRVYYKNKTSGYTSQPLLYGVQEFSIIENGNVLFIKIVNEEGVKGEKSVGKI